MIAEAFHRVITDSIKPQQFFLCLIEEVPYYGGPEEGGWWGSDTNVVAFKEYPTRELAEKAQEEIEKLAIQLNNDSKRDYGLYCLEQQKWLEDRGLDSDYLGEVDGEVKYHVRITDEIPQSTRGSRHYE